MTQTMNEFLFFIRCGPCIEAAPILSDLADKHAGKIAFVGINNDAIFGEDKPHDLEKLKATVESKKEIMRYTVVIDSADHHAKKGSLLFLFFCCGCKRPTQGGRNTTKK